MSMGTKRDYPHLIVSFIALLLSLASAGTPWVQQRFLDPEGESSLGPYTVKFFIDRICAVFDQEADADSTENTLTICFSYESITDGEFPYHYPIMVAGLMCLGVGFLCGFSAYFRHEKGRQYARAFAVLEFLGGALMVGSIAYLVFLSVESDSNSDVVSGFIGGDDGDSQLEELELQEVVGLFLVAVGAALSWLSAVLWLLCSPRTFGHLQSERKDKDVSVADVQMSSHEYDDSD